MAQDIGSFSLKDGVTEKEFTISNEIKGKALVLIFHSIDCPFAKMYEERIIDLRTRFQNQGISFALVSAESNEASKNAETLRKKVDDSGLKMPYLMDVNLEWTKHFNITKIPEVVIIIPGDNGPTAVYRGAIDNNAQAATSVTEKHLERALNQVLKGENPSPSQIRAVGCNVRSF